MKNGYINNIETQRLDKHQSKIYKKNLVHHKLTLNNLVNYFQIH